MNIVSRARVGNSNKHYRFYPLEDFLKWQRELGFSRIALFGGTPHVWIDAYSATDGNAIRYKMEELGLTPVVFMPEFSSMRYTLGSEGEARWKTDEYLKRCMQFACEMGVGNMVITADGFLLGQEEARRWTHMLERLNSLCDWAREQGLILSLMNQSFNQTAMIRKVTDAQNCLAQLNRQELCIAVDTQATYDSEETLALWLETFGDRVTYINLTNTRFDGVACAFGDGYLNLREIRQELNQHRYDREIALQCMDRVYLKKPWEVDSRAAEMLYEVFGHEEVDA